MRGADLTVTVHAYQHNRANPKTELGSGVTMAVKFVSTPAPSNTKSPPDVEMPPMGEDIVLSDEINESGERMSHRTKSPLSSKKKDG